VRKLLIAAALIAQAFAATASAETADPSWRIIQKAGEVSVTTGGFFPVSLKPDVALPEGAVVTTGATGRAILRRGAEQIALAPRSSIALITDSTERTLIRQHSGSAFFDIGKRRAPHFEVGTPFLAAVVKGTSFRVNVNGSGAAVHVEEGAVEVATVYRSAVTLVRPGKSALVRTTGKAEIQLLENGAPTRTVTENEGGWDAPPMLDAGDAAGGGGGVDFELSSADTGTAPGNASASLFRPSSAEVAERPSRSPLFTKASAPAAMPSTPRPARGRRGNDGELPMREIGLALLGLLACMLASQFFGKSQRRPARVRVRR
jgi:hypothetical protein